MSLIVTLYPTSHLTVSLPVDSLRLILALPIDLALA
jgi:hypothetical protein